MDNANDSLLVKHTVDCETDNINFQAFEPQVKHYASPAGTGSNF
jgi:hypothetical protein